ncbi:hypothetical protein [Aquibacillus salsiterrae]|uniref:YhjD n=1 Tax=Aquibacillus salsiterrae TaxID=2950439 RepID=A0A9X3WCF4_9BACI|nr:hypothetical protein [Aquibacillus salsiterrae]MDC3417245.1 hypothetical protein [Aquibacillus salsiterrae]
MRYLNEDELRLASRFLFLSMAITVIKQDLELIEQEKIFKIKEPYLRLLQKMQHVATIERRHLRKQMTDQHLQVITYEKTDSFTSFLFICKGKEEKRNYFNPAIRKKVEIIIHELMQTVAAPSRV